jgi:nicotinate phosphoribosyltransferase
MTEPIVQSLLDTDLYKFSMMQVVLHQHPAARVQYRFFCRTQEIDFTPCVTAIERQLEVLCELSFQPDELDYLRQFDYFESDFIDFLSLFRLNRCFVRISTDPFELVIEGPWLYTILFEVPLLAIINEIYFLHHHPQPNFEEGRRRLREKANLLVQHPNRSGFLFSEFGTRRRFSAHWQREVLQTLLELVPTQLMGTSNVALARTLDITPLGTMAHEFLQAFQALGPRLVDSQKAALEAWVQQYRGRLGIALTDVVGIDAFLRDFDLYFAKLFDGLRHDSGDPLEWARKVIAHYQSLHIDPQSKTLVFSDNLTIPKALTIYDAVHLESNPVFGIGTNLTNDLGYPSLDMVIKMTHCNGQAVAKISDDKNKTICQDTAYDHYLAKVFEVDSDDRL